MKADFSYMSGVCVCEKYIISYIFLIRFGMNHQFISTHREKNWPNINKGYSTNSVFPQTFLILWAKSCSLITFTLVTHTKKRNTNPIRAEKQPNSWPSLTITHVCLQSHVSLGHLFHIDVVIDSEKMWKNENREKSLNSGTKVPDPRCSRSLCDTRCMYVCARVCVGVCVRARSVKTHPVCSSRPSERSWWADIWGERERKERDKES